jgi:hypothetical protein
MIWGIHFLSFFPFLEEKRINENEVVTDLLEGLRHKTLPGVGDLSKISHAVMKQGKMSSVRMNDDNIVKILINKKLNLFEKNYHLMRVFMIEESDLPGTSRYKTIGVDGDTTVSRLVEIAQKKFKVFANDGYKYSLWSVFKNQGKYLTQF